ncbi:MAG: hypothetical protein ACK46E_06730, partial [Pseudanabaena sp.]
LNIFCRKSSEYAVSLSRFFPLTKLLSSWFIWQCGIFLRSRRGSISDWKPALNRFAILFEEIVHSSSS